MTNVAMTARSLILALLVLSGSCLAAGEVRQDTKGECANAIAYVGGNVTIQCGLQKQALEPLVASLQDFEKRTNASQQEMARMVEQSNRTLMSLLRTLEKFQTTITQRDRTISERDNTITALSDSLAKQVTRADNSVEFAQQVSDWRKRYEDLLAQWKTVRGEDEESQKAYRLTAEGKLDEAAALLKQVMEVQEKQAVAPATETASHAAQVADLRFRFDEAEALYKRAYRLAPDNADHLSRYTNFLLRQHRYAQAIRVNEEALELIPAEPSDAQQAARAMILNDLGILYNQTRRLAEAHKAYLEAHALYRRLTAVNPTAYEPALARTLTNLGNLYRDAKRFDWAENALIEARDIERRLAATNPAVYEPDLATTLNSLGVLYVTTLRLAAAEKAYIEARDIRRRLAAENPIANEPDLAIILSNLGVLYRGMDHSAEAEKAYVEARDVYRRLAAANPAAYEPYLAGILNNVGLVYGDTQRLTESEKAFVESSNIYHRLAQANPATYDPDLAGTLNNLGFLYRNTQRLAEAKAQFAEAIALLGRYAATNPGVGDSLEVALRNAQVVGVVYADTQRYAEAEKVFVQLKDVYRRLVQVNPIAYEPGFADTLTNLGMLYGKTQRLAEAEAQLMDATALLRKYAANDPNARRILRAALSNLQEIYTTNGALDKGAAVERELTALTSP